MKLNSHLQAAHNLSPGPRSGVRAWETDHIHNRLCSFLGPDGAKGVTQNVFDF